MEKINDLFDLQITNTMDAYPSIFSKDDVIQLLVNLRQSTSSAIHEMSVQNTAASSEEKFAKFGCAVKDSLENILNSNNTDLIDYDSAEFSISYNNNLTLESVSLDYDSILESLEDILLTEYQDVYGDIKTEE
jgi:hypothetical protein